MHYNNNSAFGPYLHISWMVHQFHVCPSAAPVVSAWNVLWLTDWLHSGSGTGLNGNISSYKTLNSGRLFLKCLSTAMESMTYCWWQGHYPQNPKLVSDKRNCLKNSGNVDWCDNQFGRSQFLQRYWSQNGRNKSLILQWSHRHCCRHKTSSE